MNDTHDTKPVATSADIPSTTWHGITLDDLRRRRMVALVKREVGREHFNTVIGGMRNNVRDNGVRGLLFDNHTIAGLKTADYALLGWRAFLLIRKMWQRKKK